MKPYKDWLLESLKADEEEAVGYVATGLCEESPHVALVILRDAAEARDGLTAEFFDKVGKYNEAQGGRDVVNRAYDRLLSRYPVILRQWERLKTGQPLNDDMSWERVLVFIGEIVEEWQAIIRQGGSQIPLHIEHAVAGCILEMLRQSMVWCCIEAKSDYHYIWRVEFTEESLSLVDNGSHQPVAAVESESLLVAASNASTVAIATALVRLSKKDEMHDGLV